MRVGAEGGRPLPQGEGGPGGRPEKFLKNRTYLRYFLDQIYSS